MEMGVFYELMCPVDMPLKALACPLHSEEAGSAREHPSVRRREADGEPSRPWSSPATAPLGSQRQRREEEPTNKAFTVCKPDTREI